MQQRSTINNLSNEKLSITMTAEQMMTPKTLSKTKFKIYSKRRQVCPG